MLLLAARIALIVALAVAVADPFITVRLAYGDGRTASVAIVIDDSMSMARRGTHGSLAEEAVAAAGDAIGALPEGSEVAVVLAGRPARLVVPRTDDLGAAQQALDTIATRTARGTDLATATARALRELAGARNEARRLLVLTDGARHAALDSIRFPDSRVGVDVQILEARSTANRAIVSALAVPDPTTPGRASVSVEVRAYGADAAREPTRLSLRRDGAEIDHAELDLSSGVGRATLHGPLVTEGDPSATLLLSGEDALDVDDERAVLLRPPSAVRALVVDGDPNPLRDRDEVGYVTRALDLSPASAGGIGYRVVDADAFATHELAGWDVVVLANVRVPPPHTAERLAELVEGGGGLLVAAGDRVDTRAYEARLGSLLPARIRSVATADPPIGLHRASSAEIVPEPSGLDGTHATRRFVLEAEPGAHVELVFDDGAPALVVGAHGDGHTGILALPLDLDWSDLPYRPGFLPLVAELVRRLAPRSSLPDEPVEPGTTVSISPPPGAARITVVDPIGRRHVSNGTNPFELSATELAGAYRVEVASSGSAPTEDGQSAFVVAPPAEESNLAPGPAPEDLADAGPNVAVGGEGATVKQSMAHWIFLFAGLLVVAEALLRSRRIAGAPSTPA